MSKTKDSLMTYEEKKFEQAWLELEERLAEEEVVKQDKQIGGSHYQLPIQPIDYIVKNGLGYREGNVIKYVTRHNSKNGAEDIKKAIHYLEMILKDYSE